MIHRSLPPVCVKSSLKDWAFLFWIIYSLSGFLLSNCDELIYKIQLEIKKRFPLGFEGWILRLQLRNSLDSSESLSANLEKVRQTSAWQMVPKFWFIWLSYHSSCITYKSKSLRNNKKVRTLEASNGRHESYR